MNRLSGDITRCHVALTREHVLGQYIYNQWSIYKQVTTYVRPSSTAASPLSPPQLKPRCNLLGARAPKKYTIETRGYLQPSHSRLSPSHPFLQHFYGRVEEIEITLGRREIHTPPIHNSFTEFSGTSISPYRYAWPGRPGLE